MIKWQTPRSLRTTLIYILFGSLWILLSDSILEFFIPHTSPTYPSAQTIKGWFFILVSALLLYTILSHDETVLQEHIEAERESQRLYRDLFESNPHPMWVYDLETLRFLMVNDAAIDHYGYSRDEFLRMTLKDIRPADQIPALLANLASPPKALEKSIGWQHLKKDGTLIDVEISSHSLIFEGKSARMVLVNDITESKLAEEQLRISEERFRLMAENIEEGFWITDPSANSEVYLSPANERIYGRSIEELMQTPNAFLENILPEDQPLVLEKLDMQKRGEPTSMEYRIRRNDGKIRWIWDRAFPILKEDGTAKYVTGLVSDITERKETEARIQTQLKRLSALNSIDRAISINTDLTLTLKLFIMETVTQLHVDAVDILLMNPHMQTLQPISQHGFTVTSWGNDSLKLGQGLAGRVALEQTKIIVHDLADIEDPFVRVPLHEEEGFVSYFGVPLIIKGQVKGVLEVLHRSRLDPDTEWLHFLETLGGQAAIAIENAQLFEGLQRSNQELTLAYDATIAGWSHAMDLRDKETEGHTQRVTELTLKLAERMGISEQEQVHIKRGALLHDIGKLGVPDDILHKPGKLTDEERDIMRKHPTYAHDMLIPITHLRPALDIPYCHHEKWDGSGYPRGLKGEEIPLPARVFAVVDVWDALRSDRPYRESWSAQKTRDYILAESGKHFDPNVVAAFKQLLEENPEMLLYK